MKIRPSRGGSNLLRALAGVLLWGGLAGPVLAQGRHSLVLPNDVPTFEFPLASARTSAMVGRVFHASRGESQFEAEWEAEAAIGEMWPLFALHRGKVPLNLHLGTQVYGRFSLGDQASALISNDWHVNFVLTADFRRWRLAAEAYHESSHLGDEYRDRFPGPRVNWSREIVGFWATYHKGLVKVSANASYAPIDAADLDGGAVALAVDHLGKRGGVLGGSAQTVLAVHADAQGYADWRVTWSGRAGVLFADPVGRRGFALLLSFYDGISNQRQFFNRLSRYVGMEVRFDL